MAYRIIIYKLGQLDKIRFDYIYVKNSFSFLKHKKSSKKSKGKNEK